MPELNVERLTFTYPGQQKPVFCRCMGVRLLPESYDDEGTSILLDGLGGMGNISHRNNYGDCSRQLSYWEQDELD